ncbi:hypothetical protein DPMN_183056 [Dreissena polymorpha]|uniref:Uncharacterized protein n=1 Tax=Dreissena polymorpha TaxID=45954 RepID=A0A9D4DHQ6_DREPO|nr:hypothetical protein DPMN_183056 [Dreissena polymorpha]
MVVSPDGEKCEAYDSNPGHLAYRASAFPNELTGPPHISSSIQFKFGTVTFSPASPRIFPRIRDREQCIADLDKPMGKFYGELYPPRPPVGHHCCRVVKSLQPVQDSNLGHLAYRASALPTELTGPPHIPSPVQLN